MTRERISFAVPGHLTTHNTTYLFPQVEVEPCDYRSSLVQAFQSGWIKIFILRSFLFIFIFRRSAVFFDSLERVSSRGKRRCCLKTSFKSVTEEYERTLLRFRSGKRGEGAGKTRYII